MRLQAEYRRPISVAGKRWEGALVAMIADSESVRRAKGGQALPEKCNGLSRSVALTGSATKRPLAKQSLATTGSQFQRPGTSASTSIVAAQYLFATAKSLDSMREMSMGMNVHSPE
jgi:hypothetical protein